MAIYTLLEVSQPNDCLGSVTRTTVLISRLLQLLLLVKSLGKPIYIRIHSNAPNNSVPQELGDQVFHMDVNSGIRLTQAL